MPAPVVFQFDQSAVRVVTGDAGEPWFCLRDVCSVLDLSNASPERFQLSPEGVTKFVTPTSNGDQAITFVNEPNLYRIIFRSSKPEAKKFQDWVFSDVLPTIRKTGAYSTTPAPDARLAAFERFVQQGILSALTAERAALAILGLDPDAVSVGVEKIYPPGTADAKGVAFCDPLAPDLTAKAHRVLSNLLALPLVDGLSVGTAIAQSLNGYAVASHALVRAGIRIQGNQVWFGSGIEGLRALAKQIGVGMDLRKYLLALPGAARVQTKRFDGVNSKIVSVPLDLIHEHAMGGLL